MSPVNHQHGSTDQVACVRTKKEGGVLNVLDESKTAEGNTLTKLFLDWFGDKSLHAFSIFDRPGGNGVDTNTITAPFDREVPGESVNTGLSGRDMKLHWRA